MLENSSASSVGLDSEPSRKKGEMFVCGSATNLVGGKREGAILDHISFIAPSAFIQLFSMSSRNSWNQGPNVPHLPNRSVLFQHTLHSNTNVCIIKPLKTVFQARESKVFFVFVLLASCCSLNF